MVFCAWYLKCLACPRTQSWKGAGTDLQRQAMHVPDSSNGTFSPSRRGLETEPDNIVTAVQ